jgi:assimilatory nitrate reductase catalytic subunit
MEGRPVADIRRHLLMPSRQAPAGYVPAGRIVCQCHGVAETTIAQAMAQATGSPGERLASAKAKTLCGTNCGSCVPELRRMASMHAAPVTETERRVA